MADWRSATLAALAALTLGGCSTTRAETRISDNSPAMEAADFRFAILGDRTGAHRPGLFADAMRKLELLQPDFVITVGDLIEGYTEDEAEIARQWDEAEGRLSVLSVPVFHVAGNHDYSNAVMARIWAERRGPPYWAFEHEGVLFLGLNTEDPPVVLSVQTVASARRLEEAMARDPQATQQRILDAVRARGDAPPLPGVAAISAAQFAFVRDQLKANPDARWTFLIMHKPAWRYDSAAFERIEGLLQDRPYTVIAGHEHYYAHELRHGRDYISMGTTGGVWLRNGPGQVDHIALVTMRAGKPVIANVRIDGLFGKEGQSAASQGGAGTSEN